MPACRGCGQAIRFQLTKNGKRMPISLATGVSHFADCPEAKRFSRPATVPAGECHACGSDDVEQLPGWGPHAAALRCHACRAHRWLRKDDVTP